MFVILHEKITKIIYNQHSNHLNLTSNFDDSNSRTLGFLIICNTIPPYLFCNSPVDFDLLIIPFTLTPHFIPSNGPNPISSTDPIDLDLPTPPPSDLPFTCTLVTPDTFLTLLLDTITVSVLSTNASYSINGGDVTLTRRRTRPKPFHTCDVTRLLAAVKHCTTSAIAGRFSAVDLTHLAANTASILTAVSSAVTSTFRSNISL
ncbi:hypothetical protein Hanom_Chr02g00138501 [Helianthus anomalus]